MQNACKKWKHLQPFPVFDFRNRCEPSPLHRSSVIAPIKTNWSGSQIMSTQHVCSAKSGINDILYSYLRQALNYFCTTFQCSLKRFYIKVENSYFPSQSKSIYFIRNTHCCIVFNFYKELLWSCVCEYAHILRLCIHYTVKGSTSVKLDIKMSDQDPPTALTVLVLEFFSFLSFQRLSV